MNVIPDQEPRLLHWLLHAVGIDVSPQDPRDANSPWKVEVNNGLDEQSCEGAVVAWCPTELEAELVAAGLWALVRGAQEGV